MEPEEVAVGGYDLAGELNGGLLAVADPEEDAEQLGVGEGAGSGLEQALARAKLRRELLYRVASSFQGYGCYRPAALTAATRRSGRASCR